MTTPTTVSAELPEALRPEFDAQGFREWVLRNMPDDTIIGSSAWWADHLTKWARSFVKSVPAQVEALSAAQAGVPAGAAEPTCTACGAALHEVTQSPNSYLSAEQFDADKLGDWYCKCCPQGPSEGSRTHRYFWNSDLVTPALTAAPQPSPSPAPADPDGEAFRTAARLGLTLRFYGGCAQSSMPGTPSAYEVVPGSDRAEALRKAVAQAAEVIAAGGKAQECGNTPYDEGPFTLSAPAQPGQEGERDQEFEAWAKSEGGDFAFYNCGPYNREAMRLAGMAWRAARAAPQPAVVTEPFGWVKGNEIESSKAFGGSINLWRRKYDCDTPVYLAPQPATADAVKGGV